MKQQSLFEGSDQAPRIKYTNKLGYPQYIVDWLIHDDYDHNYDPFVVSTTTLMKPTRAYLLALRHRDELEIDVSELTASSLGNAVHNSFEVIETDGVKKENRISRDMKVGDVTYTVTGKYDILEDYPGQLPVLRDIKTTSVWAYVYGNKDEGYRTQLSTYRWLLSQTREVSDVAYIDFFFTDWQSSKAKNDKDYPQQRLTAGYRVDLQSLDEIEEWVRGRLELIEANKDRKEEDIDLCKEEELWIEPAKFAVMKRNAKRATKLCDSREEANRYIETKNIKNAYIQERPLKVRRCKYCSALPFCSQGQGYKSRGLIIL